MFITHLSIKISTPSSLLVLILGLSIGQGAGETPDITAWSVFSPQAVEGCQLAIPSNFKAYWPVYTKSSVLFQEASTPAGALVDNIPAVY